MATARDSRHTTTLYFLNGVIWLTLGIWRWLKPLHMDNGSVSILAFVQVLTGLLWLAAATLYLKKPRKAGQEKESTLP